MNGGEVATEVAAGAAVLTLIGGLCKVAIDRHIAVKVTAEFDRRLQQDGIAVTARNHSTKREAKIADVEVLHSPGFLRRRQAVAAGPFIEPITPWTLTPDKSQDSWVALTAVDGSEDGKKDAKWDFSRPIKVRLTLDGRRGPKSRRCKVKRA